MATKYTFTVRFLKNFFGPITIAMMLALTACTSEKNSDGGVISIDENEQTSNANGNNNQINIDSLVDVLRNQVTTPPPTTPYVDTSYKNNLNNDEAWKDSVQQIIDSLKAAHNDSLYMNPIDTTARDEKSQSAIRNLYAEDDGVEDVYGAFANQYALMYGDFSFPNPDNIDDTITIQSPFPISITNECNDKSDLCNKKKVKVKTWISGYTDTATITAVVNPADSINLFPNFTFDNKALLSVTSAKKAQRQIEVYALENDQEIQFYSATKPITIHPMQVFGEYELSFLIYPSYKYFWYSVWVTPMADSITAIVNEVANKLPNGEILVYQKYGVYQDNEDPMGVSTWTVINAVFEVLQSRNIKYVENNGAGSIGQRINYPIETLRKKQGLCIETAVLFASVLERLGYLTSIIFIPEHAFVGWLKEPKENPEYEDFDVVETTMIGDKNATFLDANLEGIRKYYDPLGDESYAIEYVTNVPIYAMRALGILPNNIP